MQMIRQDDNGDNFERMSSFDLSKRGAQQIEMIHQQASGAFRQRDGKEVSAAGHVMSAIGSHP